MFRIQVKEMSSIFRSYTVEIIGVALHRVEVHWLQWNKFAEKPPCEGDFNILQYTSLALKSQYETCN